MEAFKDLRSQGGMLVVRKSSPETKKDVQWGKQEQQQEQPESQNPPGGSLKQSTIAWSFVKSPRDIKRKEKMTKVSIKKNDYGSIIDIIGNDNKGNGSFWKPIKRW